MKFQGKQCYEARAGLGNKGEHKKEGWWCKERHNHAFPVYKPLEMKNHSNVKIIIAGYILNILISYMYSINK